MAVTMKLVIKNHFHQIYVVIQILKHKPTFLNYSAKKFILHIACLVYYHLQFFF